MPIDPDLPAGYENDQTLRAAWDDFAHIHAAISGKVATLAGNLAPIQVALASGKRVGEVVPADFAFRFARIFWSVVEFDPENAGLGATESRFDHDRWTHALARILPEGVKRFAQWSVGLSYLALHETAHTTPLGIAVNAVLYDRHLHSDRDVPWGPHSPYWIENEKIANNIARSVAVLIGEDPFPQAGAGYFVDPQADILQAISALEAPMPVQGGARDGKP